MGERPPCRTSRTHSREAVAEAHTGNFKHAQIAEVNRPQDLIIQELPLKEQRKFFIIKKKNSKSFHLLIALGDKNSLSNQIDAWLLL